MARTAFRMSFAYDNNFSFSKTSRGRDLTMYNAICDKYECEAKPDKRNRLLILSSAFRQLQSLSQKDDKVKQVLNNFFEANLRLKKIYYTEADAFSIYSKVINSYENLGTDGDLNKAIEQIKSK